MTNLNLYEVSHSTKQCVDCVCYIEYPNKPNSGCNHLLAELLTKHFNKDCSEVQNYKLKNSEKERLNITDAEANGIVTIQYLQSLAGVGEV